MLDVVALAHLEEARQARGFATVAAEHIAVGGGVACWSGPGAWSSMAVGIGLSGPVSDVELDRLVGFYDQRQAPCQIGLVPFVDGDLIRRLGQRGFRLTRFENVLARTFAPDEDLEATLPNGWPVGVTIRAPTVAEHRRCAELSEEGFVEPAGTVNPADIEAGVRMLQSDRVHARVAFRRRGIQQALLVARLQQAQALGATIAVIDSTPGIPTERNARRLGFEGAYTKVTLTRPFTPASSASPA